MIRGAAAKLLGIDELRQDLKQRTDELMKASDSWLIATRELAKAIREHKKALEAVADKLG